MIYSQIFRHVTLGTTMGKKGVGSSEVRTLSNPSSLGRFERVGGKDPNEAVHPHLRGSEVNGNRTVAYWETGHIIIGPSVYS